MQNYYHYDSQCSCGIIKLALRLPTAIESYRPRQCDCDFCVPRKLAYLSDHAGHLSISPNVQLNQLQQGSKQAVFWQCSACKQVIAVTYQTGEDLIGAAEATLFAESHSMKAPLPVSPKTLSATEKTRRWSEIWLSVSLD